MRECIDTEIEAFEKRVKYRFNNRDLLVTAFTHASFSAENEGFAHNERMEFLGDSVLGLVVADLLFHKYPECHEGEMARLKAFAVSEPELSAAARKLDMGRCLLLGRGELSQGRDRDSILSDSFEAVICALYLDSGSLDVPKRVISGYLMPGIELLHSGKVIKDYKSSLQEYTQSHYQERPEYINVREEGPPHDKLFVVKAVLTGETLGEGSGRTKKAAEQQAAEAAWFRLHRASGLTLFLVMLILLASGMGATAYEGHLMAPSSDIRNSSFPGWSNGDEAPAITGWQVIVPDDGEKDGDNNQHADTVDTSAPDTADISARGMPDTSARGIADTSARDAADTGVEQLIRARELERIEILYYSGMYFDALYHSERFLASLAGDSPDAEKFAPSALFYAARSARMLNRFDQAEHLFNRLMKEWPGSEYAANTIGELFILDMEKQSLEEDILEIEPETEVYRYLESGDYSLRSGDLDAAFLAYKEALRLDPDYAMTCFKLGNACVQAHRAGRSGTGTDYLKLAQWYYERTISISGLYSAKINLGVLLYEKGEYSKARRQWLEVIRKGPGSPGYAMARENYRLSLRRGRMDAQGEFGMSEMTSGFSNRF